MKKLLTGYLIGFFLIGFAGVAKANGIIENIIYDNEVSIEDTFLGILASPNNQNWTHPDGSVPLDQKVADDFNLSNSYWVTDIHWLGYYVPNAIDSIPSDNFIFRFYDDNGGKPTLPNTDIYEFNAGSIINKEDTGKDLVHTYVDQYYDDVEHTLDLYAYSADIKPFQALGGNTYWLEIYNNIPTYNWSWGTMNISGGNTALIQENLMVDWDLVPYEQAFILTGEPIPEPATMLLLGTGLVGVAGAARRRKKKNQA